MEFLKLDPDPVQVEKDRRGLQVLLDRRTTFQSDEAFFQHGVGVHMFNARIIEALILMGGDTSTRVIWSHLVFMCSVGYIDQRVIALLLERGANVNQVDEEGQTALDALVEERPCCSEEDFNETQKLIRLCLRFGAVYGAMCRTRGEEPCDPRHVSLCQSVRAITAMCSPLVLPRLRKGMWLPVEMIRELQAYM